VLLQEEGSDKEIEEEEEEEEEAGDVEHITGKIITNALNLPVQKSGATEHYQKNDRDW
jgi:hypothetical protein